MEPTTLLGFAAGLLTTTAFIPQVHRIWKTRSARDVSLHTFVVFTIGVALWTAYGIAREEPAIILWNSITLVLAAAIIGMKLRFG